MAECALSAWKKDKDMSSEDFFDHMSKSLKRDADLDQDQIILSRMAKYAGSHGSRKTVVPTTESFFPAPVKSSVVSSSFMQQDKKKVEVEDPSWSLLQDAVQNQKFYMGDGPKMHFQHHTSHAKKPMYHSNGKPFASNEDKNHNVTNSGPPLSSAGSDENVYVIKGSILMGNGTNTSYPEDEDPYAG